MKPKSYEEIEEVMKAEMLITKTMEWSKWTKEIPLIPMKEGWLMRPIPPFNGAISRFNIETKEGGWCSVYFDAYDKLGIFGSPYWEIYEVDGDIDRFEMNDIKGLVASITKALKQREELK